MRNTQVVNLLCFSHLIKDESTSMITNIDLRKNVLKCLAPLAMDAIPHQDAHRNEHHNMPNVDPTRFLPVHGTTQTPQADATSWCHTTRFLMIQHIKFWKKAVFASLLWSIKTERFKLGLVPTRGDIISYGYCLNRLASANIWSWNRYHVNFLRETSTAKTFSNLPKINNTLIHWKICNDTKIWATFFELLNFRETILVESKSKLSSQASLTRDAVCLWLLKAIRSAWNQWDLWTIDSFTTFIRVIFWINKSFPSSQTSIFSSVASGGKPDLISIENAHQLFLK